VRAEDTVLVFLDSNHTKQHVLKEIQAYHQFVSPDSYIVATDGVMRDLHDVPRGSADWKWNHPAAAAEEFVRGRTDFVLEQPKWGFSESKLTQNVTHWPSAWIRKVAG
jgi:cephalosporin hydroxylase